MPRTYGCQMNERDSEQVARSLLDRGYEGSRRTEADVVLLNTCSVRDMAEQKRLGKMGMLGRIAKSARRRSSGFSAAWRRRAGELLQVDAASRSRRRHAKISSRGGLCGTSWSREERDRSARHGRPALSIVDTRRGRFAGNDPRTALAAAQATAFVSIMQGCNMHCTFCIVPRTAAPSAADDREIVREVRELVEQGVKEVTLWDKS
jgi:tRNA-2-methylthio-N6-dimethylallyladenosine synthase